MGNRRHSRELAMQFLFQHDFSGLVPQSGIRPSEKSQSLDEALKEFWDALDEAPTSETRAFSEELIRGCIAQQTELDKRIQACAEHWDLHRIAAVDRAILRLAIYEMLHRNDIPPVVSINEAVEIAKKFSTQESSKFVNGILDHIRKDLTRPARQPKG